VVAKPPATASNTAMVTIDGMFLLLSAWIVGNGKHFTDVSKVVKIDHVVQHEALD
jgi:hypothetical protein